MWNSPPLNISIQFLYKFPDARLCDFIFNQEIDKFVNEIIQESQYVITNSLDCCPLLSLNIILLNDTITFPLI